MKRLLRSFVSVRTTLVLMLLLGELLLLTIVLPQQGIADNRSFALLANDNAVSSFLLVRLGLGNMPTSPVFITVLVVFFTNLSLVLATRIRLTMRRIGVAPPSDGRLRRLGNQGRAHRLPLPPEWNGDRAAAALGTLGYRVFRPGPTSAWAVKHPRAALGFLVFHASFFVMCAAGTVLYYTRFAATAVLAEGQGFDGAYTALTHSGPLARPPTFDFALERVDQVMVGKMRQLEAEVRISDGGSSYSRTARINHPIEWANTRMLVERAGIAPELWLLDGQGFTRDRLVLIAAKNGESYPTAPMLNGKIEVGVRPVDRTSFPTREQLASLPVFVVVRQGLKTLFAGELRPGEHKAVGPWNLTLRGVRYWASLKVISERGGWLLVGAFVTAVWGLLWRLLWYRREIALVWDTNEVIVFGRSDFLPKSFIEELPRLAAHLLQAGSTPNEERRQA